MSCGEERERQLKYIQADQVKEEGSVIDAEGEIKIRYFLFFLARYVFCLCDFFFPLAFIKEKELGQ